MINPTVVEGQIAGGVVQGIGGVLLEDFVYDEHGNPLTTTFMDYLLPTATDVPEIEYGHIETPASTPGDYKGVGEGGAIGAPAAVANAVNDALALVGAHVADRAVHTRTHRRSPGGRRPLTRRRRQTNIIWRTTVGLALLERSAGRSRHRRLEEADHAVNEVGGLQGERDCWTSLGAGAFAICGGMHGHLHGLAQSVRAQRFVDTAEAGAQLLLVFLLTSPNRFGTVLERLPTVLRDGSDEAHVAAVAELALLEDDDDLALQPAP